MQYLGIEYQIRNLPALDRAFIPFGVWASAYEKGAERPFKIAVERENGLVTVYETKLRGPAFAEANYRYAERCVKMLLWSVGGWRVYLCGDDAIAKRIFFLYFLFCRKHFDFFLNFIHAVSDIFNNCVFFCHIRQQFLVIFFSFILLFH